MEFFSLFENPKFVTNLVAKHKDILFISNMEINLDINKLNNVKNNRKKLLEFTVNLVKNNSFLSRNDIYLNSNIKEDFNIKRDVDGFITHNDNFISTLYDNAYILNEKIEENIGPCFSFNITSFQKSKEDFLGLISYYFDFQLNEILTNIGSNFRVSSLIYSFTNDYLIISIVIYSKDINSNDIDIVHRDILANRVSIIRSWRRVNYRSNV